MFIFQGEQEVCDNNKCECLVGSDGECIEYPIPCASEVGQSSCDGLLKGSECDSSTNW